MKTDVRKKIVNYIKENRPTELTPWTEIKSISVIEMFDEEKGTDLRPLTKYIFNGCITKPDSWFRTSHLCDDEGTCWCPDCNAWTNRCEHTDQYGKEITTDQMISEIENVDLTDGIQIDIKCGFYCE